jgi:hypothetical protein
MGRMGVNNFLLDLIEMKVDQYLMFIVSFFFGGVYAEMTSGSRFRAQKAVLAVYH